MANMTLSIDDEIKAKMHTFLSENGIRCAIDLRKETVQYKVRDAELQKVPYMATVGEKEKEKNTIAVRPRKGKVEFGVKPADFLAKIKKEIQEKKL